MADEAVRLKPNIGVEVDTDVAVDDVDGKAYQRLKLDAGADGVSDPLVAKVPGTLPVSVSGTVLSALADSPSIDAFSRARISESEGLFDSTFQYDVSDLTYESLVTASGTITHNANESSAVLTVTGAGDSAILQSRAYHRYIPAKSQLVVLTQVPGAPVAGVVKRWGYFDADDGVFFEQNGTVDFAVVRRTSTSGTPVDNRVAQASWNLDTLDGNGPSGLTLDLSKAQITIIDFQWLGMGRVRMGFDIDGLVVYCHEFLNANVLIVPYMRTANLPNRWEVVSTGGAATFKATCASVISEGGKEKDRGLLFTALTGSRAALEDVASPLIAYRPAATFNGLTNRIQIQPSVFGVFDVGNNPMIAKVFYRPTSITGGTWSAPNAFSSVEVNTDFSAFAGGLLLGTLFIPGTNKASGAAAEDFSSRFPLTLDINGANPIEMLMTVEGVGGNSAAIGKVSWKELA